MTHAEVISLESSYDAKSLMEYFCNVLFLTNLFYPNIYLFIYLIREENPKRFHVRFVQ